MKWTLNKKLIIMMAALSASVIITMSVFNYYSEKALLAAIQKKTSEITESIHLAIEEITTKERHDDMRLYEYLKRLKSEGIKEISIIDGATRITASTNPFKVGETTPEHITELIFKSEVGEFVTKEGNIYHIIIPVVARGEHQGYIHLEVFTDDITGILKTHVRKRMIATVLIFLTGLVFAVWLSSRYTRPIKEVVASAKAVASGDLDIHLPVKERDEIGELKESFNQMTERLRESRALEQRWREIEHLSTIGELARTVAHEIRNPLNFISLSVDHLLDRSDDKQVKQLLQNIKEEIKRLDSLVGNFLTYGRPLKIQPVTVRVLDLIDETIRLIEAKAEKGGISIKRLYEIDPSVTLKLDPELIKTCLINVFQNAFQSMPEGGILTIEVIREQGFVRIMVSDTGEGIDASVLEKVFEPFFTTRQRGVGLGLALTRRVIEEHGGSVEIESQKGMGTRIAFVLPDNRPEA